MTKHHVNLFFVFILVSGFCLAANANEKSEPGSQDQKALLQLEQEVQQLKEEVFEAKSKVRKLRETVLKGDIAGSKTLIDFSNQAEGIFTLDHAEFYLDDNLIYKVVRDGKKKLGTKFRVFDEGVPTGEHKIKVKVAYRGSNKKALAAFKYFKDEELVIEKSEDFIVEYGKTTLVKLVALDKGYFKGKFKDRILVDVQIVQDWGTDTSK